MSITSRVEELATVMRRLGVVRAKINATSLELDLGPEVHKPVESLAKTDDQILAEAKRKKEERDAILFAASEGFIDEVSE